MREPDATASSSAETKSTIGDGVDSVGEAGATSSKSVGYGTCGVCRTVFPTTRGASQHERLVHPELYHGKRMHLVTRAGLSKARWCS